MDFPFFDFDKDFLTSEDLLFLAGASGSLIEATATGNPATFTTDVSKPLKSFVVPFYPIQAGSGDPSPSNVRNISGFTGITAYRTGKNIFDGNFPGINENIKYTPLYVGNGKFTASCDMPLGTYGNLFILAGNVSTGASTGRNNVNKNVSRKVTASDGYITLAYRGNQDCDPREYNVQIEAGETATAYEAYIGTTIPVSWQTEAGEVYGGELDALSGVLTVTHKFIDLTKQTGWVKSSSYPGGFYLNVQTFGVKPQTPFICSHAKSVTSVSAYVYGTCFCDSSVNIRIMESGSELTDWATYRTEQSQNGTPVCICAELATPQTIQLDPITLSTLIGENVVWTDTNGDNTITYFKRT